jgi:glycosyltransferase involved in cell wall biosynthesis
MSAEVSTVYVAPDKMGGVFNLIGNLLKHRRRDVRGAHVVLTHNRTDTDMRGDGSLVADSLATVEYELPGENLFSVMRRLARAVPRGRGVYVASDLLDLATASVHDFGRAVILIIHGDSEYYYDLAVRHEPVVHAFVAASKRMYDTLVERLPARRATIFCLPYGVEIPAETRRAATGTLRAVFAGRLDHQSKGVFDLPGIDQGLRDRGVRVEWTIAGGGPDEKELRARWAFNSDVRWVGALPAFELAALYRHQDLFIMPSRTEGFPVGLLEAMAAGLVPLATAIDSGIPDIVGTDGHAGLLIPPGDTHQFVDAVAALAADRPRLEAMSAQVRTNTASRFDIVRRAQDYEDLYARWAEFYRPVASRRHLTYGSRLDQTWLPNSLVRFVRAALVQRS